MTRKDYVALAKAIQEARSRMRAKGALNGLGASIALDIATVEIADVLQWDNSNFDRERFYKAAGHGE